MVSGIEHAAEVTFADLLALVGDLDLESLVGRALPLAAGHVGARAGALWVRDDAGEVASVHRLGMDHEAVARLRRGLPDVTGPQRWDDPDLGPAVAAPIGGGESGVEAGVLVLARPDTGRFNDQDQLVVARLGRVLDVVVANARAFSHSERRRRLVEVSARVSEALHPPFRLVEPVNRIVDGTAELMGSELVALVRCGEHGYDVAAAVSPTAGALPELLEKLSPSIREAQETGALFEVPHDEKGTVVGVPLNPELAFEGVMVVRVDRGRGSLPAEDRELLSALVTHSSLVLDRAVLLRERQEAVVAADRHRIARDLHDLVVQRVFATGLKLQAVRHSGDLDRMRVEVDDAVTELDATIRDIRATIFELEHGPDASLRAEVAALVRDYQPLLGLQPTVRTWGPLNSLVGQPLAKQVLAVLREALSNCVRHAAASRCLVELVVEDEWLTLRVTDDGRGLPAEEVRESGLRNLRHRAEAHGGRLQLHPANPTGTRLEWSVPVTDAD